jgi:hypothetical protein
MAELPLLLFAGSAIYAVPQINKAFEKDLRAPTESEKLTNDQAQNMQHVGANASVWKTLVHKQFLMGNPVSDVQGINFDGGGYVPDRAYDPMNRVHKQHVEMTQFDRADTLLSLYSDRGEVRPRRGQPIVTTLTQELRHPTDGSRVTGFLAQSYVPGFANEAQLAAAARVAVSDDPERSLRRQEGSQFFLRAPFQSFRYSED